MKPFVTVAGGLALLALLGLGGCRTRLVAAVAPAGTAGDRALIGDWRMSAVAINGDDFFPPSNIGWEVYVRLNGDGTLNVHEVRQRDTRRGTGGWSAGDGRVNIQTGNHNWLGSYTVAADKFRLTDVQNYDGEGGCASFEFTRAIRRRPAASKIGS